MGNKKASIHIWLLSFLFMMWGAMVYIHYEQRVMIKEYQDVIAKQDSMIRDMSFSNELVKEYFDIKEDSLTHQRSYVLKSEKGITKKEKEYLKVEPGILLDGAEVTVDELIAHFNANEHEKGEIINILAEKYNFLVRNYNVIVKERNVLSDSLQIHRVALGLIKKGFGIDYTSQIKDSIISVHLLCDQADSAFVLLRYYRDKITYDSDKKAWIITR